MTSVAFGSEAHANLVQRCAFLRGRIGAVLNDRDRLQAAAQSTQNVMPPILDAVRAYATIGEMCDVLRVVWGEYEEVAVI